MLPRAMATVVVIRHSRVQCSSLPSGGPSENFWLAVHQADPASEDLERAPLLRRLRAVLLRCEVDPLAIATAHLDAADEYRAKGDHDATDAALRDAVRAASRYEGPAYRRDHCEASLLRHLWMRGEPHGELCERLRELQGEAAERLVRDIAARADARIVLQEAEDEHRLSQSVGSHCELAVSHMLAGHDVQAELVVREVSRRHPHSGLAWHTLASLLEHLGRFRDAIEPAQKALELADDPAFDRERLARLRARLDPAPCKAPEAPLPSRTPDGHTS